MAANGMMFVCANTRCGHAADSPRGWLTVIDTRGGTIADPNSATWWLCSFSCLDEWSSTFRPVEETDPSKRRRIRGPQELVGQERDRE